jgi:hypothetical protein
MQQEVCGARACHINPKRAHVSAQLQPLRTSSILYFTIFTTIITGSAICVVHAVYLFGSALQSYLCMFLKPDNKVSFLTTTIITGSAICVVHAVYLFGSAFQSYLCMFLKPDNKVSFLTTTIITGSAIYVVCAGVSLRQCIQSDIYMFTEH